MIQTGYTPRLTQKEARERLRLNRKWATQRATKAEMLRCMDLDRKADYCAANEKAKP